VTRVVAVLGGGGAKAIAHVGAWRALEEAGLAPAHVIGTSFGAVIGAAFAAGLGHRAVASVAAGITRDRVARVDPIALVAGSFASSFLQADPLREVIREFVPARWFTDLKLPLSVTATDLDSGDLVLFGACGNADAPLLEALYASCALPLYYAPGEVAGRRYGDGGLRAVLGLEAARALQADLVVAVHVGPGFDEPPPAPGGRDGMLPPLLRAHGEALRIMMAAQVERQIAAWPADAPPLLLVRPVAEREATFATGQAAEYVEAGYRATRSALAEAGPAIRG
jgi:NTE family protein